MPLSPGLRLGPYEITTRIGVGGMGEVWQARDTRLDRNVAIKVLPPAMADEPDRLQRFEREAKALAALNHPGILAIYGFEQHTNGTFAVTELLVGQNLRDRLRHGPMPVEKALAAAAQIAEALAAAHGKGIVHRDLKPENLWVLADGRLKILDFGLARRLPPGGLLGGNSSAALLTSSTESGAILGTVGYMAPEQVRGEPADARSDLFAFGLVLHEMLTGSLPFRGDTPFQTLHAVLEQEVPPLVGPRGPLPAAVQRLVLHCLEKAPEARFQNARDLAFALRGLLDDGGARAAVPAGRRKRRGPVLALGALLLAAGAGVGLLLPGSHDAPPALHFTALTPMEELTAVARFGPDGRTVLVGQASAPWREPTAFQLAIDDPTRHQPLLDRPACLAGVSSKDEFAVLDRPGFLNGWFHYFRGNLSVGRLGQSEPRLVAEDIAGMDWSPDGATMAVLHCRSPRGMAVECPPGHVLATTDGWFSSLRFSPDGRQLAWAMHPLREDDGGTAYVCDVAGGTPRAVGETWSRINGVAFHPHRDELWVGGSDAYTGEIAAYDRSGHKRTVYNLPYVVFLHDIDQAGRVLLGQGNIEVGCATVEADGHAAPLGGRFVQLMAASRDGTWWLLGDVGTWRDFRCDIHLQQFGRQLPTILGRGLISCCGAFAPDDQTAAFVAQDDAGLRVRQFPVAGGKPCDLPLAPLTEVVGLAYDGRGRLWALGHHGDEPLALHRLEDGKAPAPLATPLPAGVLAFSIPPGSTEAIVVVRDQPLHAVPLDGGPVRPLPFGLGGVVPSPFPMENGDRFLGWEDGGAALFVSRDTRPPVRVERVELATGTRTLASTFQSPDTSWGAPCLLVAGGRRLLAVTPRFNQQLFLVEGLR